MARATLDYNASEQTMQFTTYQALAVWIEETALAYIQKEPKKMLGCLETLFMYLHMKLKDSENIRERLDHVRETLYSEMNRDPRVISGLLLEMYSISLLFTKKMDEENMLFQIKRDLDNLLGSR